MDYFTNTRSIIALSYWTRVAHVFGLRAAIGFHPLFRTDNKFIEKLLAGLVFEIVILELLGDRPTNVVTR